MRHSIFIERAAQKSLAKVPNSHQDRIIDAIAHLEENPRPSGVKKLTGRDAWRIRVGDYRIICEIQDGALRVLVIRIGNRREVYR